VAGRVTRNKMGNRDKRNKINRRNKEGGNKVNRSNMSEKGNNSWNRGKQIKKIISIREKKNRRGIRDNR
jgi:hypothetical protein